MIAKKAKRGSGFAIRIDYILEEEKTKEQRGKFLACSTDLSSSIPIGESNQINGNEITMAMEEQASKNTRVKNACYHQIFSFPEGERPSDEILSDISKEFAQEFGFTQWLSVKHEDTKKLHIHFVGNIVNNQGKVSVNDSNDYYRLNDFIKYINEKHDLQRVGTIKEKGETTENKQIQRLQKIIDKAILTEGVNDIKSFQKQLLKSGIKSLTQRGIAFVDSYSGAKFKGSKLGRGYSLNSLEKRIKEKDIQQEIKIDPFQFIKTIIENECLKSKNLEEFSKKLDGYQISTSSLNHQLTFKIEDKVIDGNLLGEDYSLKNVRFNLGKSTWTSREQQKEILKLEIQKSIKDVPANTVQSIDNVFDSLDNRGWKVIAENKHFTNSQNEIVNYTQLSFKSKDGLLINDYELKNKDANLNPYGFNGIVKEIEKNNQSVLKNDSKKAELIELISLAAVKSQNINQFTELLKENDIDFIHKSFINKDTNELVETIRFKKDGAIYTSRELGEDLSLDNLKYNINAHLDSFVTRTSLKDGLIQDIQNVFHVETFKESLNLNQLNTLLAEKNWKIEVSEKYFKNSDNNFIPYAQYKYVDLSNPNKFVYDYELRNKEETENKNYYSAKSITQLLDKNKASLVRNALTDSLNNAKYYNELAYLLYMNSGILIDKEDRTFETKDKRKIEYKETIFYVPADNRNNVTQKISEEFFLNNRNNILNGVQKDGFEKISLSEINKIGIGSKISNTDITDILRENRNAIHDGALKELKNNISEDTENRLLLEQDTLLKDLKRLVLGKVTQGGHAQVKREEQKDIRSKEEKRKDELRRQGKI